MKKKGLRFVVIGGGLAGLTAALEAASRLDVKEVMLLEKNYIGGNSMRATSGINGLGNSLNHDLFISDVERSSRLDYSHELVETLVAKSNEALDWLRNKGIVLESPRLLGGHQCPRSHRVLDKTSGQPLHIGSTIMLQLKKLCLETDRITLYESSKVTGLVKKNGSVVGVQYNDRDGKKREVMCDRIILATGGYSSNRDLVSKVNTDYLYLGTTNGAFAQGDGLFLGSGAGGKLIGMNHIQLHPTGFVDPKNPDKTEQILAPEIFRSLGGILVDRSGSRFTNEMGKRSDIVKDIFQHGDLSSALMKGRPMVFLIVDENIVQIFGKGMFNFYLKQGLFRKCETVNILSEQIRNESLTGNLLYETCHAKLEAPFYLATVSPVIHYTMGGLSINREAQVLDGENRPIPNLYAAGEVTGGIHGENRLAGNSLLECIVFGRISAASI